MNELTINGKPAVKIFAKAIKHTDKAILFDCEGDQVWLPKSTVKVIDDDTILVDESMYDQKF